MELGYENLSLDGLRQQLSEQENNLQEIGKVIQDAYDKQDVIYTNINKLNNEIRKRTLENLQLYELYCTYGVPEYHYSEFEIYRVLKATKCWIDYIEYCYRNDDGELYLRIKKHHTPLLSFVESIEDMKVIDEDKFKELIDKAIMLEEIPCETNN